MRVHHANFPKRRLKKESITLNQGGNIVATDIFTPADQKMGLSHKTTEKL
jgi:hypothetical protein